MPGDSFVVAGNRLFLVLISWFIVAGVDTVILAVDTLGSQNASGTLNSEYSSRIK